MHVCSYCEIRNREGRTGAFIIKFNRLLYTQFFYFFSLFTFLYIFVVICDTWRQTKKGVVWGDEAKRQYILYKLSQFIMTRLRGEEGGKSERTRRERHGSNVVIHEWQSFLESIVTYVRTRMGVSIIMIIIMINKKKYFVVCYKWL